jgi:hypothetical protein
MELKVIGESDKELWDRVVYESPQGTLFHSWKWLKIVEDYSKKIVFRKTYKTQLFPLMVFENAEIVGILPVFFYDIPFFKTVLSPATGVENLYLGPVLHNPEKFNQNKQQTRLLEFQNQIDSFIKNTLKARYILIKTSPGLTDLRPFKWSGYEVEPQYTYELDLTIGKEKIWNEFSRRLKQDINQVKKNGISVEIGSRDDFEFIYDSLKKRARINAEKKYILEIFDTFAPRNLTIFIVKHEDRKISGLAVICYKNKVWFWLGNPRMTDNGPSPNTLMFWEAINWAIEHGYENLEIIGADTFDLFSFKRKFGGTPTLFFKTRWLSPGFKSLESVYTIFK